MFELHHRLPQIPSMRSLRNLLHHHKLLRTRFLSNPRLLPSNITWRCSSSHRLICSDSRGWEEESRVWSGIGEPAERPRIWTGYDPLADELVTREEEPSGGEVVHMAENSTQKRPSSRAKDTDEDSSEGDEKPQVWTFYDPLAGQFITKVAGEETPEEEPRRKEGIPGKEKSVQKRPSVRVKKSGDALTEGEEKNMVSSGSSSLAWSSVVKRRAGKVKVSWVCENCGATPGQWWGACPSCQSPGSVKQFSESEVSRARGTEVSEAALRAWLPQRPGSQVPQSLTEVNKGRNQSEWRIPLSGHFGMEVSRVLGGGLVPGSLVLVGGDPGVGKSTLLLQIAAIIAQGHGFKGPAPVVYVSGEESIEQIGNRADRMRITTSDLFLYSSTDIEDILDKIQVLSPQALIVDSIQTVYLRGLPGSAGNIVQVKECTSALLRFAKQTNIPVLLIGHVTKTGDIAGPRILEHIVDAVLYMEGERYSSYRLLRSVKNRFGSTDELGVFEMSDAGLDAVSNPSEMFLSDHYSDSEVLAGLAVAVIVDGSRAFVIEIQALCVYGSSVSRNVNGVQESRADMIISVLMKQAGLKLHDNVRAIFVNVVSGVKLTETAGDLAIAAAICSSFLEFPIPNNIAFIGEIGLGGELRAVPRMDKRVIALAKLGYKKCVIPKTAEKMLGALSLDIEILGCRTLKEVINSVFSAD